MQGVIQQQLHRARQLMKDQADKKRSFRQFQVGDQVFLKLQPYIQTSVAPRANHKLSYKFYRPFPIIAKINEVAYKLQLPPDATVHPVFHVSMLRRALLPGTEANPEPKNDVAYELELPPQATVHPVFHVSQLRQALLPGTTASTTLPPQEEDLAVPVAVLQSR